MIKEDYHKFWESVFPVVGIVYAVVIAIVCVVAIHLPVDYYKSEAQLSPHIAMDVSSTQSGHVSNVYVKAGDQVVEGDPLIRVSNSHDLGGSLHNNDQVVRAPISGTVLYIDPIAG